MEKRKLSGKDYALWVISVLAFFAFFLWVGDFGNLAYLTQSPITSYVNTLWRVTYIAAGGVFGVFMGSIVFLSVKFRAIDVTTQRNYTNYYYAILILDLIAAIAVTYEMFTFTTQFTIGLLGAADLFIFASIIYLVYKLYYSS